MKSALITGVGGQDGSYMAELLLERGYRVVGASRSGESCSIQDGPLETVPWSMTDEASIRAALKWVRPAELYNFAAYSSGAGMFDDPLGMAQVNGVAVARILEAIREVDPAIRFCQASSSEMFGQPVSAPQDENTPFRPRSPYGAAKAYAHSMIGIYRRRYGLFACSAILFNHESPRRGAAFVTRKVTDAAVAIRLGLQRDVRLGNLSARRDWGFAGDYVHAMWRMLQADSPDDFVIATGKTHSVRDLCECAFGRVGLDYRDYVREDASSYRPDESMQLVGDPTRAASVLGWSPKVGFPALVHMMVDAALERLSRSAQRG